MGPESIVNTLMMKIFYLKVDPKVITQDRTLNTPGMFSIERTPSPALFWLITFSLRVFHLAKGRTHNTSIFSIETLFSLSTILVHICKYGPLL